MRKALAVCRKELRQIATRPADADDSRLRARVLPPALRLRPELGHPAHRAGGRRIAMARPRAGRSSRRSSTRATSIASADAYSPEALDALLDRNAARAVLVIPEGFGRDLIRGGSPQVQVIVNGDNANTATTVMGYATHHCRQRRRVSGHPPGDATGASRDGRAAHLVQPRASQHAVPRARADRLHRDDHRRRLDGAVDRAREGARHDGAGAHGADRRRSRSSSARRIPYFVISLVSAALIILAAMVLFGLPMRGTWLSLLVALSLFLVGALGTGLLISTHRRHAAGRVPGWRCSRRFCRR